MGELGAIPEKAVKSILEGNADLNAVRPAARNYFDHLPQDPVYPATTYTVMDDDIAVTHDKHSGPGKARIRVSVWDDENHLSRCRQVAELVKGALQLFNGTAAGIKVQRIFFDPGTAGVIFHKSEDQTLPVYQYHMDFIIWWRL